MNGNYIKKTLLLLLSVLLLCSCTKDPSAEESLFISTLESADFSVNLGIDLTSMSYEEELDDFNQIYNDKSIKFNNIYTFNDNGSDDYGYIYEISDGDAQNSFFTERNEYSLNENNIIFVYTLDHYILEAYHSVDSTFPGLLRQYDFEGNYQYHLHYTNELEYHPFTTSLMTRMDEIMFEYDRDILIEGEYTYTSLNIPLQSAIKLYNSELYFSVFIIETYNQDDAVQIFNNQCDFYLPQSSNTKYYAQYQNLIFRLTYDGVDNFDDILAYIFEDLDYDIYSGATCLNNWTY